MESNWRSNNYYDSQESYGNTNLNNNPFQFNNFSKTLILILIIILILYNHPSSKNIKKPQEDLNNNYPNFKNKDTLISEKELVKARECFQEFLYKDIIDFSRNLHYNLYIPEFIPEETIIPLIIYINDANIIGKEPKFFLEPFGSIIWATDVWQEQHKCFVLVPAYNEIIIDNSNEYIKSPYIDITVRLISYIKTKFNSIDPDRIYITGEGIGGMASLYFISNYPYIFSAGLIIGGQLYLNEFKGLINSTFTYISLMEDKISYNSQKEIKIYLSSSEIKINYGSINNINLNENPDLINMYIYNMFNLGYRHNFITFTKDDDNDNNDNNNQENYGYKYKTIREWLFNQKMKNYDEYYKTKDGRLVQTKFCSKADNNNICIKCIDGYYLSKDRSACTLDKNCQKGDSKKGLCTQCVNNYYFDIKTKKCYSNTEKKEFKYCKEVNEGICTLCEKYYYLDMNHKCTNTENCEESQNARCIICIDKYFLGKDNKCTDVDKCIYSSNGECTECQDGFYYDRINKQCKEWSNEFLKNCKSTNLYDSNKCAACKDDFYLNRKQNLCKENTKKNKFYKCQITNDKGDACAFCVKDYFLGRIDKKCSSIQGCLSSKDENFCLECDNDFCLDNKGNCINNYEINEINQKYFYRCSILNENGNGCSKCEKDYLEINNNGLCYDKLHCEIFNKGSCKKCKKENKEGYNSYCLNREFGCIDSFQKNCLRCDDILNLNECTECEPGYELDKDGNCVK